jgi:hypothetical protein
LRRLTLPKESSLSHLATTALTDVVRWPKKRIHFGQIPNQWFKFSDKVGALIQKDANWGALLGTTALDQRQGSERRSDPGRYLCEHHDQ